MKTKTHFGNKIILLLFCLGGLFFYSSCSNHTIQKQISENHKLDTCVPQVSVVIPDSATSLPDTWSPPYTLIVPEKITNNSILPKNGIKVSKLSPPETKTADFFSQMQNYNTDNGLAMDIVNCAYTDHRGNIWFGTRGGGASCYNGKSFINYTTAQGLVHNFVWSIIEDRKGNIWFGTNGGASCFDGKAFTNFTTSQGLPNNGILRVKEDKVGNIWFATNGGGISCYNGKSFSNYSEAQGLVYNIVWSFAEDKIGNLWIGTDSGVSCYNGNRVDAIERGDPIAQKTQKDIKRENGKLMKSFTNYSIKELAHVDVEEIASIVEDKLGNIWFGSHAGGLVRYDGNRVDAIERGDSIARKTQEDIKKVNGKLVKSFTRFTTTQGLANNWVWNIKEDKSGNLWLGTNGGGVSRFDGKSFTNFTTAQGLSNNYVSGITEDKSGNIWFGTLGGGISRFDGKSFTNFTTSQGLANNGVWSIMEDRTGNLWFGTDGGGVSRYDGNRIDAIASGDSVAEQNQQDLKKINDKLVKTFTNYTLKQGLIMDNVLCAMDDRIGNLWFGAYNGVSRYDGNRVEAIERGDPIAKRNQQDIKRINGKLVKSFTNYITWDAPIYNSVLCMKEDKVGNLWFGTKKGVIRYDGNRVDAIENGDSIAIKNQQGLKKTKGKFVKSFINYTIEQGLAGNRVTCITEDKIGNLWFGTTKGVSRYDGNRVEAIGVGDSISEQNQKDLKKINGKLVESFTNYTTAQGMANNVITCIAEDKNGNVWIGFDGGGVCRFDGKTFLNYTTAQGLPDDIVTQVIITKEENILFGTNSGIAMLSSFYPEASMQPVPERKGNLSAQNNLSNDELKNYTPIFEIYNSSTGYPVKGVNTGQNAMFLDSKGVVWISTGSDKTGLVRFDYKELNKNNKPPEVVIQNIRINSEPIIWNDLISTSKVVTTRSDSASPSASTVEEITTLGKVLNETMRDSMRQKFGNIKFNGITKFDPVPENLALPYSHNHITFDFTAIEPARPSLVRYQYKLEGYDKEWNPITDQTSAVYGNMYEGNYIFKLKARSPFGVWSQPIEYKFTVMPPWWRSGWMYTIYGVIFLLIIITSYFIVVYRIKTIRKREEEKTRLNKQISATEMKALRSQMNPHFIFNVMNSVQHYILENDRVTAQDYLAKFARLMRHVLENSKAENITLDNEIETLKLYVLLEQLRAPGKFTYKVNVEPSISIMDTLIMPMLIQPFIENAILHGMMHKTGNDGKIELNIKRSNDQLVCVIEDNGIGRKSAQKIKAARSTTHKSLGMNVTEERISIINNLHGKNAAVIIEDQTDENMNPSGTKVTLTVPYIIQND